MAPSALDLTRHGSWRAYSVACFTLDMILARLLYTDRRDLPRVETRHERHGRSFVARWQFSSMEWCILLKASDHGSLHPLQAVICQELLFFQRVPTACVIILVCRYVQLCSCAARSMYIWADADVCDVTIPVLSRPGPCTGNLLVRFRPVFVCSVGPVNSLAWTHRLEETLPRGIQKVWKGILCSGRWRM